MTRLKLFLLSVALALLVAPNIHAQTVTTRTTLSVAIATTNSGTITVTPVSMTGIVATSNNGNANAISSTFNFCLIDGELGQVVNGTVTSTTFNWRRGSSPSQHATGAEIHCGAGGYTWTPSASGGGTTAGIFGSRPEQAPVGACTRANNQFLPVFLVAQGKVMGYDCPNTINATTGLWVEWQIFPAAKITNYARTVLPFSGTAVSTKYTALPFDGYIAITTTFGVAQTAILITLPCATSPPGTIWTVADEGGGAGTSSDTIGITGSFFDTQVITTGFTAKTYTTNGSSCFRAW